MNEEMKKAIFRRYRDYKFNFTTWEELKQATKIKDNDTIKCFYCNIELEAEGQPPYDKVVSLDRKTPQALGGKNTLENTCLCCTKCNKTKGTMTAKTFFKYLDKQKENKPLWELV